MNKTSPARNHSRIESTAARNNYSQEEDGKRLCCNIVALAAARRTRAGMAVPE